MVFADIRAAASTTPRYWMESLHIGFGSVLTDWLMQTNSILESKNVSKHRCALSMSQQGRSFLLPAPGEQHTMGLLMVGGLLVLDHPEVVARVGADATATDARDAAVQAEKLLGSVTQARPS